MLADGNLLRAHFNLASVSANLLSGLVHQYRLIDDGIATLVRPVLEEWRQGGGEPAPSGDEAERDLADYLALKHSLGSERHNLIHRLRDSYFEQPDALPGAVRWLWSQGNNHTLSALDEIVGYEMSPTVEPVRSVDLWGLVTSNGAAGDVGQGIAVTSVESAMIVLDGSRAPRSAEASRYREDVRLPACILALGVSQAIDELDRARFRRRGLSEVTGTVAAGELAALLGLVAIVLRTEPAPLGDEFEDRQAERRRLVETATRLSLPPRAAYNVACFWTIEGEYERALASLASAIDSSPALRALAVGDPSLAALATASPGAWGRLVVQAPVKEPVPEPAPIAERPG